MPDNTRTINTLIVPQPIFLRDSSGKRRAYFNPAITIYISIAYKNICHNRTEKLLALYSYLDVASSLSQHLPQTHGIFDLHDFHAHAAVHVKEESRVCVQHPAMTRTISAPYCQPTYPTSKKKPRP